MNIKRIIVASASLLFLLFCLFFIADIIVENFLVNKSHIRRIFNFYLTNTENNLILLIGSSQIREDMDAVLIQTHVKNYQVYNLGYSGDTPTRRLVDLPYIIRLKPKVVVIGIDYFQISGNYKTPLEDFKVVADLVDQSQSRKNDLFYDGNISSIMEWNWIQVLDYRLRQLVPALNYQLKNMFSSKKESFYDLKQPFSYTGTQNTDSKMKQLYSVMDSRYIISNRKNEEKLAFTYLLNSLRENGIKVIVVDMPNHPALNDKMTVSSKNNYEDYINSEIKKRCDLYVSYKNDFDDSYFYDATHMNKAGRDVLSTKISGHITNILREK